MELIIYRVKQTRYTFKKKQKLTYLAPILSVKHVTSKAALWTPLGRVGNSLWEAEIGGP